MKELKIEIPEGYEIDKEKSTFENIVFKKKKEKINSYDDLKVISGYFISAQSQIYSESYLGTKIPANYNVFKTKAQAESALAMAQLSQILPYYDTDVDWDNPYKAKYCIICCTSDHGQNLGVDDFYTNKNFLAFNSEDDARRFLYNNEKLIRDYFMMPKS